MGTKGLTKLLKSKKNRQLYVEGLPKVFTEESLVEHFSVHGEVTSLRSNKRKAVVEFGTQLEAKTVSRIHGMIYDGHTLTMRRLGFRKRFNIKKEQNKENSS